MIRDKLIERCRDEQAKLAKATLENPGEFSATNYAHNAGVFLGLSVAIDLIKLVLDEEENERKPKPPKF